MSFYYTKIAGMIAWPSALIFPLWGLAAACLAAVLLGAVVIARQAW